MNTPVAKPSENLEVLVVDDSPSALIMISDTAKVGHWARDGAVGEAKNYAEATRLIERYGPPKLLVTDLGLPDGCGFDLATGVLKLNPLTHVYIITGSDTQPPENLREHTSNPQLVSKQTDIDYSAIFKREHNQFYPSVDLGE
ncbi:MAG: response regulator [Candidatus Nanoarchaeia archaeon]